MVRKLAAVTGLLSGAPVSISLMLLFDFSEGVNLAAVLFALALFLIGPVATVFSSWRLLHGRRYAEILHIVWLTVSAILSVIAAVVAPSIWWMVALLLAFVSLLLTVLLLVRSWRR
jgi:hypothetical protein